MPTVYSLYLLIYKIITIVKEIRKQIKRATNADPFKINLLLLLFNKLCIFIKTIKENNSN